MRRQAEQHATLQRQQSAEQTGVPTPMTIEEWIDASPWPEWRKEFVRQNPAMVAQENRRYVDFYSHQANEAGISRDSIEFDRFILRRMTQEKEMVARAREEAQAERPAVAPSVARPEAPRVRSDVQKPNIQRSMPMAAPVSREAPNVSSGQRRSNDMTLSAEERDIARNSIMDRPDMPKLTDAQKEYIYQQNRERMRELRRQGIITDGGGR
jgi:hypothetical protein